MELHCHAIRMHTLYALPPRESMHAELRNVFDNLALHREHRAQSLTIHAATEPFKQTRMYMQLDKNKTNDRA